ncbi:MAG: glycosyltransferase [Terriglobales bacterium]
MQFSVVLATYNRLHLLAKTLPGVLAQDFPAEEFEVIVVSDGSTDGTMEWLQTLKPACRFTVLGQENRGQSAALNVGLQHASGELVLLLDDDILCPPDLLRQHADAHAETTNAFVVGPIHVAEESTPGLATEWTRRWVQQKYDRLERQSGPVGIFDMMAGANCSVPRALLIQCGGFDESNPGARALGLRLARAGAKARFRAAARTEQIFVKSADQLVRNDLVRYGRNEVRLCRQFPEYRPHSMLASLGDGPWWKRVRRAVVARLPFSPDLLLAACFRMVEKLLGRKTFRRLGIRLLDFRLGSAMLRSAAATAGSWAQLRREFGMRLPVLVYHHVGPLREGVNKSITISAKRFEQHIRWLSRHGYKSITTSEWDAWLRGERVLPEKPVLITLDDGYADTAQFALPILERYGFRAVMYIVTGMLGQSNLWDGFNTRGTLKILTADEIVHWAARGFEFGAHTRRHADVTRITGEDLRDEILGSGQDLERLLGKRPRSFAYPWGRRNSTARACVAEGYRFGFSTDPKVNALNTDPACLFRTTIWPYDTLLDLRFNVWFGLSPLYRVRNRLLHELYSLYKFARRRRVTA